MKNKVVGPYIIAKLAELDNAIYENDTVVQEKIIQDLMSRAEYRACLEANYGELYKELKEAQFLYIKRD